MVVEESVHGLNAGTIPISLRKQQFVITHTTDQTDIPTLRQLGYETHITCMPKCHVHKNVTHSFTKI
jgi:hypothetical protein